MNQAEVRPFFDLLLGITAQLLVERLENVLGFYQSNLGHLDILLIQASNVSSDEIVDFRPELDAGGSSANDDKVKEAFAFFLRQTGLQCRLEVAQDLVAYLSGILDFLRANAVRAY